MSQGFLPKFIKPSLISRLSHIVFLQIVFVFGALAIVLIFPVEPPDIMEKSKSIEEKMITATKRLSAVISFEWLPDSPTYFPPELKDKIESLLYAEDWISQADIFVSDLTGKQVLVHSYVPVQNQAHKVSVSPLNLKLKADGTASMVGPVFSGDDYLIYYFPFVIGKKNQSYLATAVSHDMMVSNKGQVRQALLLIFLGATLLSLFTVYLVIKWFHNPLTKLIQRLSKTAAGGIYYQLETEGESESDKLTKAFNEMSAQLYDNKRELTEYHNLLNETSRTMITSKRFLSALINNSPHSLIVTSEEGQVLIFSREALKTFGFDSDREIIGRDIQDLFAQAVEDLISETGNLENQDGVEALCWRQGRTMFPAYVTISPIDIGEEGRKAYLYIVRDITESKSFQQMMIRLNKNYTRGEMAGDIAHDINNYLAVLLGNIELIPMFLKKNDAEKVEQKLGQMKGTLEKIGQYAAGLMDSEHDELFFERTHINQIIENVLAFVRPQKKYAGIEIKTSLNPDIPSFDADSGKLQQLIVNLLSNSCDAVAGKEGEKRVGITTRMTDDSKRIRVEVTDNGPGVNEDRIPSLFQNRFTTKRKGHGIGLITCRRIVEAHQGRAGYDFTGGTMFYVELPLFLNLLSRQSAESALSESAKPSVS